MATVTEVTDTKFESEVLKSPLPVLVDFHATWCGPCKVLSAVVEEVATELSAKLKVVKVDVDEAQDAAAKFGIMSVPTLILFRGGKEAGRLVGAMPKGALVTQLNRMLG